MGMLHPSKITDGILRQAVKDAVDAKRARCAEHGWEFEPYRLTGQYWARKACLELGDDGKWIYDDKLISFMAGAPALHRGLSEKGIVIGQGGQAVEEKPSDNSPPSSVIVLANGKFEVAKRCEV